MKCKYEAKCSNFRDYSKTTFNYCNSCKKIMEVFPEDETAFDDHWDWIEVKLERYCSCGTEISASEVIEGLQTLGFSNEAIRKMWNDYLFQFKCCFCFEGGLF